MKAADFILIQVNEGDAFYELARVRPYLTEDDDWGEELGYYCNGFGQNNGRIYEFSLHLGKDEAYIKHKFVNLGYPVENINREKLKVDIGRSKIKLQKSKKH